MVLLNLKETEEKLKKKIHQEPTQLGNEIKEIVRDDIEEAKQMSIKKVRPPWQAKVVKKNNDQFNIKILKTMI